LTGACGSGGIERTVKPVRTLVAVPDRLYGDALAAALAREAAIEIAGICLCRDEVTRGVRALKPDVLLLDPELPGEGDLTGTCSDVRLILLARDACMADLVRALRGVAEGAAGSSRADRRRDGPPPRLTAREREIIELIDEGLSNKEIASRLSIELSTAKNHVHNILEKLRVDSRTEAAGALRRAEGGPVRDTGSAIRSSPTA
jgi:DNA-binding CsgD family transcriptional regulator